MTKNPSRIEFTEEMKTRIEKMQRPIINDREELERTQIGGTFAIVSNYTDDVYRASGAMMARIFDKLAREQGQSEPIFTVDDVYKALTIYASVANDEAREHVKKKGYSDEEIDDMNAMHEEVYTSIFEDMILPPMAETNRDIIGGMNTVAINYAGMVLEGKMSPIWDQSLEGEDERKNTRKSAEKMMMNAGIQMGMGGAMEEGSDGKLHMRKEMKTFNTIDDHEEELANG